MNDDWLSFLFNAYKSFLKINVPSLSKYEEFMLRKSLFGAYNFLSLKLEDRFLLLKNNLTDTKIKSFLVFLYNMECDFMRTNELKLSWLNLCSNKENIFDDIYRRYHHNASMKVYKRILEDIEIDFMIGYEKYFFNIKDEFLVFLLKRSYLLVEDILEYYDKTTLIENQSSDKLFELKLIEIIHGLYSRTNKKSLAMRLILKLFSHQIVLCDHLEYDALFQNETIYFKVNHKLNKAMLETILLHEATHSICRYEEKYIDFLDAYNGEFSNNEITSIWSKAKEVCINQILSYYTNNQFFDKMIFKDNYYTLSIVVTSLLALKQLRKQKEGLSWK
jgi:hypothetical protein